MTATAGRRSPLQALTVNGEQITAVPMAAGDLVELAEDFAALAFPQDRHGFNAPRGWHLYDDAGRHFGRVYGQAGILAAEWFDDAEESDWRLATADCRRLVRAVCEIQRLRDEIMRPHLARFAQRAEELREKYRRDSDDEPAAPVAEAPVPTFGEFFGV